MEIYSNIVEENKLREVQKRTLQILSDALVKSFGPMGSYTTIVKNMDPKGVNISVDSTKDGHTIIKNILFQNPIERSVQDLLVDLTHHVVKEVGDGTTSAIVLCNSIFKCLCDNDVFKNEPPSDVLNKFSNIVKVISDRIKQKSRECTIEDIYNIALISTNNNEEIAGTLREIYKRYGLDVYIDVGISTEVDNLVKEYDGMTLDTGLSDPCFINNKSNNSCTIRNPKIYAFNDPIDTPEMLNMLDAILYNNILQAYTPNSVYEPVPTVILSKTITPDASSYLETIVKLMNTQGLNVPLLIVSDIHQDYELEDITKMCGAPLIKKYLNPDLQQKDIEAGLAPTTDTILDFCGSADEVVSDQYKTKIINPSKMFNADGTYSDDYNMMINYLENQIVQAKAEDMSDNEIGRLRKRLNSFKGNMIDFLIGGITLSDRNTLKASVEDAVLNCRSAAKNGVGYGANFMALSVLDEMINEDEYKNDKIVRVLYEAYGELVCILYDKSFKDKAGEIVVESLNKGCPLNIRTKEYDGKVLSSISSDIIILDTVNRILGLMYTSNQYLLQLPVYNIY